MVAAAYPPDPEAYDVALDALYDRIVADQQALGG